MVLSGCAGAGTTGQSGPDGTVLTALGDWNDINAAVDVAASAGEVAVLSANPAEVNPRVFQLQSVENQPGRLTVEAGASEAASTPRPVAMTLRCRIGHFGDPEREARVLEALAERLDDLAGVDYHPLD
jgi:hypothetical protein